MTQTNTIEENLIVRDGQAVSALDRVGAKVGGIRNALGGIRTMVAGAAGIAGLMGVAHSVASITELYQRVGRLRAVTGLAGSSIHGMLDQFELTGASNQTAERVITRLTALSQRAKGSSKEAQKLNSTLERVGVNMKGGAAEGLLSMATAVQKGKLGINDMARTFKIPLAQAGQVMKTLEQGPGRLKAIMDATKGGADVIDNQALASFERMQQAKRDMADSWEAMVGTLYKTFLPTVTTILTKMTAWMQRMEPLVTKVGSILSDHMDAVVKSAKLYLMYMVAAKAVETGTGGKKTLGGLAKDALGGGEKGGPLKDLMSKLFGSGKLGGIAKSAATALEPKAGTVVAKIEAKGLAGLGQAFAKIGKEATMRRAVGTILPGVGQALPAAGGILGKMAPLLARISSLLPVLRLVGSLIGRFGIVGLVIMTVIGTISAMYKILSRDIGGHATRLKSLFSDFMSQIMGIYQALKPAIDIIKKIFGYYFMGVAHAIFYYVEASLKVINTIMRVITAIGYFIGQLFSHPVDTARHLGQALADAWFKAGPNSNLGKALPQAKAKKEEEKGNKKPPPPNQDFRGSHFTINQNFAEGFDPGRVSVAITNDLAATADRRRQSGFAPTFAMRPGGSW